MNKKKKDMTQTCKQMSYIEGQKDKDKHSERHETERREADMK